MKVASRTVVSIEYELSNEQGTVLDSNKGFAALDFVQGAGTILPAIEQALYGSVINENKKITLLPSHAFGLYDEAQVYRLPIQAYRHTGFVNVDDVIQMPDGREATIVAADENYLTADANHPLAGQTLYYDVTIKSIRAATQEEIFTGQPISAMQCCSGKPGCC
ncbi:peptidylprolyl isomerase [Ferruginibacter paludis]|uniref:FKBP-type peptidyl-prolyl cis-trans isomerase n=1 Tax=Ferruginibacter paludis TaxID=1310417 RepID=UPI0025B29ACF|nr:peptidylprolyl isomerase [Ferruginibacter paludis]MDN3658153.1 peptidylprolyl isomerase [Ferruginibacter paludis]